MAGRKETRKSSSSSGSGDGGRPRTGKAEEKDDASFSWVRLAIATLAFYVVFTLALQYYQEQQYASMMESTASVFDEATMYMTQGMDLEKDEKYAEAVEVYTEALAVAKADHRYRADLHSSRAFAYLEMEKFDLAVADATLAIRLKGATSASAAADYMVRGFAFDSQGRRANAKDDFAKCVRLDPGNEVAKRMLDTLSAPPRNCKEVASINRIVPGPFLSAALKTKDWTYCRSE